MSTDTSEHAINELKRDAKAVDFAKRVAETAEKIDLGFHTNCPNEDEIAIAKDCFIGGANWAAQELSKPELSGNCPECKRLWDEAERVKAERDALRAENEQDKKQIERLKALEIDHLADMTRIQDAEREVERLRAELEQAKSELIRVTANNTWYQHWSAVDKEIQSLNNLAESYRSILAKFAAFSDYNIGYIKPVTKGEDLMSLIDEARAALAEGSEK